MVRIHLSLRRNKKQTNKALRYDWFSLVNNDICNDCAITVRNRSGTLQETSEKRTPNDEYEDFVTTHQETVTELGAYQPNQKSNEGFFWSPKQFHLKSIFNTFKVK